MSSNTEIANMALGHIGSGKTIANLETETSREATACRTFYTTALEETLRAFNWPFATKIEALALIEEDPNDEWQYSYRYPAYCLKARRILSGTRNDTRQSRVSYKLAFDDAGKIIYSDQEDATLEYTYNLTDPEFYPTDFILALSYKLASLVAPQLTGGDPFKLQDSTMKMFMFYINQAAITSFNEQQDEQETDSEFMRTRE